MSSETAIQYFWVEQRWKPISQFQYECFKRKDGLCDNKYSFYRVYFFHLLQRHQAVWT